MFASTVGKRGASSIFQKMFRLNSASFHGGTQPRASHTGKIKVTFTLFQRQSLLLQNFPHDFVAILSNVPSHIV